MDEAAQQARAQALIEQRYRCEDCRRELGTERYPKVSMRVAGGLPVAF